MTNVSNTTEKVDLTEGQLLFQIQQTGIIGQVHQNNGFKKSIYVHVTPRSFQIKVNKHFKEKQTESVIDLSESFVNQYTLRGIQYDFQTDRIIQNYRLDLKQSLTISNLERIVNQLTDNQVLILCISTFVDSDNTDLRNVYNQLKQLYELNHFQNSRDLKFQNVHIISGKTKKCITGSASYNPNSDAVLFHQFNDVQDISISGYGTDFIPSSKRNIITRNSNVSIISKTNINGISEFNLSGSIRKNTQIISSHADAKFVIKYYNSNNQLIESDYVQEKSSGIFKSFQKDFVVPDGTTSFELILEHPNSVTIPGELEVKNLQMYQKNGNYKSPLMPENHLISISKVGIETQKYTESVGFDPNDIDSYKEEFESDNNLYRNSRFPQIVEEPVKFFNEIIDQNKRIVSKANARETIVSLPEITIDAHKSYLIGVWISTGDTTNTVKLEMNSGTGQIFKEINSTVVRDNTNMVLSESDNSNKNFKFYYCVLYPYGQRKLSQEQRQVLFEKFSRQFESINQDKITTTNYQFLTFNKKGEHQIQPKIRFQSASNQVHGNIVMPIIKDLQIAQFDTNEVVQMNLVEDRKDLNV